MEHKRRRFLHFLLADAIFQKDSLAALGWF
jgi:hypothetical protein